MPTNFNVGGTSADVNARQLHFTDGTTQVTAASSPAALLVGVAVCTGGGPTITYPTPYTNQSSPVVLLMPFDGIDTHSIFWSVSAVGTPGNWTGFTLNLSGSVFGAYAYVIVPNPN